MQQPLTSAGAAVINAMWRIPTPLRFTLLIFAIHSDRSGRVELPLTKVAELTGRSYRQVQRNVVELEATGHLVREEESPGKPVVYSVRSDPT